MSNSFLQQSPVVFLADRYILETILLAGLMSGGSWSNISPGPARILNRQLLPQSSLRLGKEQAMRS